MVNVLNFRAEGRWCDARSLPLCCFRRQDTLPHIVSLLPGVSMGTGDKLRGGNPAMHPVQAGGAILSVSSCYRNRDKLQLCGPPHPRRPVGS